MMPLFAVGLLLIASVADAGVTFVRWGRTTCPTGVHKLYSGYMAAGQWNYGGSGARYLCMHPKPDFVRGVPGIQGSSGMIMGVELEYAAHFKDLIKSENIPDGTLHDEDMPCVRCYVADSTSEFVLPGRQDCGDTGFDLQYKGYLVSEWHRPSPRGDYVCLDEAPEGVQGGSRDTGGATTGVVVPVEVGCNSLPCNPYVEGMEVTCAVCTF